MICPKCGNEFEGTSCPKCDTPAILVNASDYERRKREWEEREKLKNQEEYRKRKNKEDVQRIAKELANADYKKAISSKAGKIAFFAAKHKKAVLALAVLLIAALAALFIGIKMSADADMQIYVSSDNAIYRGTQTDSALCKTDELVYNRNNTKAYMLKFPAQLDKDGIISSMCSDNGKYFAAVSYQEDEKADKGSIPEENVVIGESDSTAVNGNALSEGTYTVYVWERNGDCFTVASDQNEKTLQNISTDGILTFTDTEYMNEGVIRAVSLCAADITNGSMVLYSGSVSEFLLTKQCCVWLETDGMLYAGMADKNIISELSLSAVRIADNANRIYPGIKENAYSHQNAFLQPDDMQEFIYATADGEFINCNVSNIDKIKQKYLFKTRDTITDIVYESVYGCAYVFSRNELIRYTDIPVKDEIEDTKERKAQAVGNILLSKDFFYSENDRLLYFINENGALIKISHKNKNAFDMEEILAGVSAGSIENVYGIQEGFLCRKDNSLYYVHPGGIKTAVLKENADEKAPVLAVSDGKRIYCLLKGNLRCVSIDSGDAEELGRVQNIWIGRVFLE